MKQASSEYLQSLQVGDVVIRQLMGQINMPVRVGHIEDEIIYCGPVTNPDGWREGWKFDRQHGCEIRDEDGCSSFIMEATDDG